MSEMVWFDISHLTFYAFSKLQKNRPNNLFLSLKHICFTVDPPYNEPPYNELLYITNMNPGTDFL
ncbi:hypothetical protein BpHYR1_003404 [Brachionus plicatilis]|uniref:Uncharacterized protein n=1 Tax=Brachionus plicatilis TaxID=10195 RepID=A0A3M7R1V8_BRAPC|nr:hypothetical protein BpHYR1_003404 [Brachionus plicatilis]